MLSARKGDLFAATGHSSRCGLDGESLEFQRRMRHEINGSEGSAGTEIGESTGSAWLHWNIKLREGECSIS